ncbi:MAG TPA: outer membrane beta-barrel protein, partial [Ilumatobacteraceae bacterium]
FGPTLGHKSDKFFGGEVGWRLTKDLDIYVEATHMGNVGTSDLDARATPIANFLGGTASTAYVVNAFDVGVKYNIVATPRIHPYVLAGVGLAHVSTEVEFAVNGTVIDPGATVQLGSDLSGSTNRGMFGIGFGVKVPFKEQFFADLGYRFAQIFSKSADAETLPSIPTQRVVLGVGMRF